MKTAPLDHEATIEDLWKVEGRAELIDGQIVEMSPTGKRPGWAAAVIHRSLEQQEVGGAGTVVSQGVGFVLRTPRTQMLSPDVAWWTGHTDLDGEFYAGAPALAVEIRSKTDYGFAAERAMAYKRSLYFAGGCTVVWDVDVLRDETIRVCRPDDETGTVFHRGELADAEPVVPGWRFAVDDLFTR
ncbi:Uma2 family endonuclease [Longimicrobium terrae]|uniref:Uma2 family endonuclease n=1 Tax=Longimicrobium terrae TaxID=1639882 RepID=A0A841GZN4_9BACT|nr:Uma2 family endonuclease [Longimicrobium terrae]MBB4636771.1 Uma2 family endonuclease [Longimicrobium terrae]MBB6071230.1 Uma2 family endonuclease [Longimicrobium terrae]NNC29276.1 Uma2 family endonuclease [Longimicrobium terrae]